MDVLFVSKPLVTPLHDGSLCLVDAVATHLGRWRGHVMTAGSDGPEPWSEAGVTSVPAYRQAGSFAPGLRQNAQALTHLITDGSDVWHFVFAPNPRTSSVLRWLRRVRFTPVVQTVASPPRSFDQSQRLLFGDVAVCHSQWTRRALLSGWMPSTPPPRLEVIPPAFSPGAPPDRDSMATLRRSLGLAPDERVLVYPGDLEFGSGAARVMQLALDLARGNQSVTIVFACRKKTERAQRRELELRQRLSGCRVRFAGEVPSLPVLLATADVVLFPVSDLYGKVDIPYAVLEACAVGTPVVCSDVGPIAEIAGLIQCGFSRSETDGQRDLLQSVNELLGSRDAIRACARDQREALAYFDASKAAAAYEALYDAITGEGVRPVG